MAKHLQLLNSSQGFIGLFFQLFFSFFFFLFLAVGAVLGPHQCAGFFSSCGKRGPPLAMVPGSLIAVASPTLEHGLQRAGLSSCSTWAQ